MLRVAQVDSRLIASIPHCLEAPWILTSLWRKSKLELPAEAVGACDFLQEDDQKLLAKWVICGSNNLGSDQAVLHIALLIQYSQQPEILQFVLDWFIIVNTYYL